MAQALVLETSFIPPTTAITSYTIRFPKRQITDRCWGGKGGGGQASVYETSVLPLP